MQTKIIERYFFFGLLSATLLFTIILFRPFLTTIIIGASLAVVLYPLYEWFQRKKVPDWLAALLVVMFFIFILFGPLLGFGLIILKQSQSLYYAVVNGGVAGPFINYIGDSINQILPPGSTFDINQKVSDLIFSMTGSIASIFSFTFSLVFSLFLVLLTLYYFLKDGARWRKSLIIFSPLADADDEKILNKLANSINGIMKGYFLIALAQGILMGSGMAFFGIPNPALWGVAAAVASLIPSIGTALIAIPAIFFLFVMGQTTEAIGFAIWSFILVGTVDNFLNPLIIGKTIAIPQILVLFSVLGGLLLLGPVGMLIGPLTISLLYALISIYRNEFK